MTLDMKEGSSRSRWRSSSQMATRCFFCSGVRCLGWRRKRDWTGGDKNSCCATPNVHTAKPIGTISGDVASSRSQQKNIHVVPSVGGLCELVFELFDPPTYIMLQVVISTTPRCRRRSWRWVKLIPETCRAFANYHNKHINDITLDQLMHYLKMHGTMNLKNKKLCTSKHLKGANQLISVMETPRG
jgi:hypothetical protein